MTKRQIAETFLNLASSGDVQNAFDKFVHPQFIHHNTWFAGDRQTLLTAMADNAKQFPNKKYETIRSLEDGNLATVHGKVVLAADSQWSVIHIFRFDGDLIVEMWEASQQVLADSPNKNGIF